LHFTIERQHLKHTRFPCPGSSGVEQWIENPRVGGSIPPPGTTKSKKKLSKYKARCQNLTYVHLCQMVWFALIYCDRL
jgi:hypothetical protein